MTNLEKKVNYILKKLKEINKGIKIKDFEEFTSLDNGYIYASCDNGTVKEDKKIDVKYFADRSQYLNLKQDVENIENVIIPDLRDFIELNIGMIVENIFTMSGQGDGNNNYYADCRVLHRESSEVLSNTQGKDVLLSYNSDTGDTSMYIKEGSLIDLKIQNFNRVKFNMFTIDNKIAFSAIVKANDFQVFDINRVNYKIHNCEYYNNNSKMNSILNAGVWITTNTRIEILS